MTLRKYQEVMERLTVSDELRERTLKAVQKGVRARQRRKRVLRFAPLAAAAVLALVLLPMGGMLLRPNMRGAASSAMTAGKAADEVSEAVVQAQGNAEEADRGDTAQEGADFEADTAPETGAAAGTVEEAAEAEEAAVYGCEELSSAKELAERTGVDIRELTDLPFAPTQTQYTAYSDALAEIRYLAGDKEIRLRKSAGTEDNSGDYTDYADVQTISLAGQSVTLKGEGESVSLALWSDGTWSCSISADPALSREEMTALVQSAVSQ